MGSKIPFFRRHVLCRLRLCPFKPASNDHGCWGECVHCGKRSGYVSREAIRRYMEAEERDQRICSELAELASQPAKEPSR